MAKLNLALFAFALAFHSSVAPAQSRTNPGSTSGAVNSAYLNLGYAAGGLNFGGAYEYLFNGAQSIGGQVHLFPKDQGHLAYGYTIVGAFTGFHFYKGDWDLSFAPGLNIMNVGSVVTSIKDETILGPSFSLSLVVAISSRLSLGFDYVNYYGWFTNFYRGLRVSDTELKLKLNF